MWKSWTKSRLLECQGSVVVYLQNRFRNNVQHKPIHTFWQRIREFHDADSEQPIQVGSEREWCAEWKWEKYEDRDSRAVQKQ